MWNRNRKVCVCRRFTILVDHGFEGNSIDKVPALKPVPIHRSYSTFRLSSLKKAYRFEMDLLETPMADDSETKDHKRDNKSTNERSVFGFDTIQQEAGRTLQTTEFVSKAGPLFGQIRIVECKDDQTNTNHASTEISQIFGFPLRWLSRINKNKSNRNQFGVRYDAIMWPGLKFGISMMNMQNIQDKMVNSNRMSKWKRKRLGSKPI